MIYIKINRYTIKKLEQAIEKHNKENDYSVWDYVDIINRALEEFLKKKKK